MISSFCRRTSHLFPRFGSVLCMLLFLVSGFAVAPASAQLPSNVYRPPTDNFNQGQQPDRTAQGRQIFRQNQGNPQVIQNFQQGQTYQTVPQYQTVPGTPQYVYPPQNGTPIYQQPIQEVPGQVVPQQGQVVPAQNDAENAELKRSLVKARDLMEKYQIKLEDISRRNQELESQITTLQQSGDMSDAASQELAAAKAAAAQAQEQMSVVDNRLQNALKDLQTSTGDLDRQKQMSVELQQQIVELQKAAPVSYTHLTLPTIYSV